MNIRTAIIRGCRILVCIKGPSTAIIDWKVSLNIISNDDRWKLLPVQFNLCHFFRNAIHGKGMYIVGAYLAHKIRERIFRENRLDIKKKLSLSARQETSGLGDVLKVKVEEHAGFVIGP
jgi:hypothetical protein